MACIPPAGRYYGIYMYNNSLYVCIMVVMPCNSTYSLIEVVLLPYWYVRMYCNSMFIWYIQWYCEKNSSIT